MSLGFLAFQGFGVVACFAALAVNVRAARQSRRAEATWRKMSEEAHRAMIDVRIEQSTARIIRSRFESVGIDYDQIFDLIDRLEFMGHNGGALEITDDGLRFDDQSETLYIVSRPAPALNPICTHYARAK